MTSYFTNSMNPPSTIKSKSFFDYPPREKKRIVRAATRESNRAQRELMEKNQPREAWENEARVSPSYDTSLSWQRRLADFLGKYHVVLNGVRAHDPFIKSKDDGGGMCCAEHKQEIIDFVELLLSRQKQEIRREVTREIHEIVKHNADHKNQTMKTQQIGEEIMDWLIAHKKFALSDAVREGREEDGR